VAFQTKNAEGVRLIDRSAINAVLVLVLLTSTLGPTLTEYFGRQRLAQQDAEAHGSDFLAQPAH
jgi:hypothetical protein